MSTPLSPPPNASSKSKLKAATLPVSISPAGTPLKGLNFLKGREDPLALPEEDYPEWLWKILESGKKRSEEGKEEVGDEFCMSLLLLLLFPTIIP
jgi:large subunit ribosomal protein L54